MVRLALTLALLLAVLPCAKGQWTLQSSPTTADLRGIDNVGNGIVWASGSDGTILRTTDSGRNWQRCTIPPNAAPLDFRGIQAFDATTAIAMSSGTGDQSRLYKTSDGCQSWTLLFTNPDKDGFFDALQLPANKTSRSKALLLLGDPVKVYFPIWVVHSFSSRRSSVRSLRYLPFAFHSDEVVFAASNSTLFAISTNNDFLFATGGPSGASVIRTKPNNNSDIYPPPFVYSSAEVPVGVHTASSGVFSMSLAYRPGNQRHHGLPLILRKGERFVQAQGVAVGGDYLKPNDPTSTAAFTTDRGKHWQAATTPPHGYRSAVAYDPTTRTWITVGPNCTDISTDEGRNWRALTPSKDEPADADKHWNALSLPYVVGPHGRIGKLSPKALVP